MADTYLTFEQYTQMGGSVSASSFEEIERKARRLLDYFTQNRLKNATITDIDGLNDTMFEFIEKMAKTDENGGEKVTSFSNGTVSMSFDNSSTLEQDLYHIALVNLPVSIISGVVE